MRRHRDGARTATSHRWLFALAALACGLCQGTLDAAELQPLFTNTSRFRIPFMFDAEEMARIGAAEVQLHVSTDQGQSWRVAESVTPTAQKFTFTAPGDGDYTFAVRTIDLQGRAHPGNGLDPSLRVVVDQTAPQLMISLAQLGPGHVRIDWQVIDNFPASDELRLEYLDVASGAWQPIPHDLTVNGSATWDVTNAGALQVRGSAADLAGNQVTTEAEVEVTAVVPMPSQQYERPDFREPVADASSNPVNSGSYPMILPNRPHAAVPVYPSSVTRTAPAANEPMAISSYPNAPLRLSEAGAPRVQPQPLPTAGAELSFGSLAGARRVNSRNFRIGYEIEDVGPSGVGSVDLYITETNGRQWFHYGADPDRISPFDVLAPRDGVYGFAIRVRNGIGVVANPPQPGEQPEIVIVVDQTAPIARLTSIQQASTQGLHQVQVNWFVQDDQLAERPVALYESNSATGPWEPITGWMENSGQFVWSVSPQAPRSVYIKLEVRDAAGNVNSTVADRPLLLDSSRPTARILDVQSVQPLGGIR
ncbi:MAG: hypothetical protein R3B90_19150 [Planctomycetaceae bacterium]